MTLRIEVDEMGRHILILPDDIVEEFALQDGDTVTADFPFEEVMEIHF